MDFFLKKLINAIIAILLECKIKKKNVMLFHLGSVISYTLTKI